MSRPVQVSESELSEILSAVRDRDNRAAVRHAEMILSDEVVRVLLDLPDSADSVLTRSDAMPADTEAPNVHPSADLSNIADMRDPSARGLAASTYLSTLELWAQKFRTVRDKAIMQLLSEDIGPADIARRTGVSVSHVKILKEAVRRRSGEGT